MRNDEIRFQFQATGKTGKGILSVSIAGCAIHTARIDVASPVARRRFLRALQKKRPHLDLKESQRSLEKLASEVLESPNEQARLTQANLLVDVGSCAELFHDGETAYATAQVTTAQVLGREPHGKTIPVHSETYEIRRKGFRLWLSREFYAKYGKVPGSQAMQEAIEILAGKALFDGQRKPVAVRIAEHEGNIYLDLANDAWEAVRITRGRWEVVANPPVKFTRPAGMQPLPIPVRGGTLEDLRPLINACDESNWCLTISWLVGALRPNGPYAILAINGQQGSGKSIACRMLRRLIDPNKADTRSAPRDERDLMIAAKNGLIAAFDNLSRIPPALSDSLCRLSTGAGFGIRELYTDDSEKLFQAARPILFNGIEELATRPDLLERSIVITLPTISDKERKAEADLWREYERVRPQVLGALLDAVSTALGRISTTKLSAPPRMADFATWISAAELKLPWKSGRFMRCYAANQNDAKALAVDASPVGPGILELMRKRSRWTGTIKKLLHRLNFRADDDARKRLDWPKTPRGLAGALRRLAPPLLALRIKVTFPKRAAEGYFVILERVGPRRSRRSDVHGSAPERPERPERVMRVHSKSLGDSRNKTAPDEQRPEGKGAGDHPKIIIVPKGDKKPRAGKRSGTD